MEEKIDRLLDRGVINIIPDNQQLRTKLLSGEKLNIYLGVDPTATKIHLGHAVSLRKLQQLVELEHNVTFLIGDFTTLIGDASDKESERPILTKEQIQENFRTYKKQAGRILDFQKVRLEYNSKWLSKLSFEDIVKLSQNFSVGDFIGRELIRKRLESGKRVRLDEMLYPLMQGYDSYYMDTDIQVGGADQTFNMQAGRTLQNKLRNKESFVLVVDYLMGTDGRKMSKSWGNAIWLEDEPNNMYGKVMSLEDDLIEQYYLLATSLDVEQVNEKIEMAKKDPMSAKKDLAFRIVEELRSQESAQQAQQHFEKTFQEGKLPENVRSLAIPQADDITVVDAIALEVGSKSEAKRLVEQGAVQRNQQKVEDFGEGVEDGDVLKIGKKNFVRIKREG